MTRQTVSSLLERFGNLLAVALLGLLTYPVSRHIITIDIAHANSLVLIGVAALVAAMDLAYFLVRRAHPARLTPTSHEEE